MLPRDASLALQLTGARPPGVRESASCIPYYSFPSPTGDLAFLGKCMNRYWLQKKSMAPGCEPLAVQRMMETLQPYVYGQSLAGAGGGGFLYILTKKPRQEAALQRLLAEKEVRCVLGTAAGHTLQAWGSRKPRGKFRYKPCWMGRDK